MRGLATKSTPSILETINIREQIFDRAEFGITIVNLDGIIEYTNDAEANLHGYQSAAELQGQNVKVFAPSRRKKITSEEIKTFRQKWKRVRRNVRHTAEGPMEFDIELISSPVYDSRGEPIGILTISRDVSDELAKEAQIQEAQRLEAASLFAAGIAHNINNALAAIMGHCGLMLEFLHSKNKKTGLQLAQLCSEGLREILSASQQVGKLVCQLQDFARPESIKNPEPGDISLLISSHRTFIGVLVPNNIQIRYELEPEIPYISINQSEFYQILNNLVKNSIEAIGKGIGSIKISTNYTKEKVILEVYDTGKGFTEEEMEKVFMPFFTTKQFGNGLGMSVTHTMVKKHGGDIQISSKPHQGTTVRVSFPVYKI